MNSEVKEILEKYCKKFEKSIIYKNTVLPEPYLSAADLIENFEVREDDIWLCGLPKSGTTWCQEMIWDIANDLKFEAAKVNILERFPFFEYSATLSDNGVSPSKEKDSSSPSLPAYFENSLEYVKNLPSPRFIKTHLPFHLLPCQLRTNEKKAKLVYIWRNPKDVCISRYHFHAWMNWYSGDFTNYCKLFLNDGMSFMPYWNHIIEYWNRRHEENILFLRYEDLKADLRSEIKRTANFLGKNLNDDQISKLEKHLSFSSMSANQAVNHEDLVAAQKSRNDGKFMRKGETGQWRSEMSREMVDQFDTWIRENLKNHESLLREVL